VLLEIGEQRRGADSSQTVANSGGGDADASLLTVCLNPRQVLSASDGLKPGAGFALNSQ